jgi:hypothetical protein
VEKSVTGSRGRDVDLAAMNADAIGLRAPATANTVPMSTGMRLRADLAMRRAHAVS